MHCIQDGKSITASTITYVPAAVAKDNSLILNNMYYTISFTIKPQLSKYYIHTYVPAAVAKSNCLFSTL